MEVRYSCGSPLKVILLRSLIDVACRSEVAVLPVDILGVWSLVSVAVAVGGIVCLIGDSTLGGVGCSIRV